MNTRTCGCSTETCGCCEGIQVVTPMPTANRPGLNSLSYRIGTHGAFLESMKARLLVMGMTITASDDQTRKTLRPLQSLTTRDPGDFSIALLDGWATVADVLTFYQERIVNEGYLRTATERRSVLELARLVGYGLRPGVAASVFLAYTVDDNQKEPVLIDTGARSQSIPGPGEQPQSFETSEKLLARAEWSNLKPRMTQPQAIQSSDGKTINTDTLYFEGTNTGLKANDPLLLDFTTTQILLHVKSIETDFPNNLTKVGLQESPQLSVAKSMLSPKPTVKVESNPFDALVEPLSIEPEQPYPASAFLPRNLVDAMGTKSDTLPQLASLFSPAIASTIYPAWSNAPVTELQQPKIYAFRVQASPFGSNAPLKPITDNQGKVVGFEEWPLAGSVTVALRFNFPPPIVINVRKAAATQSMLPVEFTLIKGLDSVSVATDVKTGDTVSISDWKITVEFDLEKLAKFTILDSKGKKMTVVFTVDEQAILGIQFDGDSRQVTLGQLINFTHGGRSVSAEYTLDYEVAFSQRIPLGFDSKILDLDTQSDQIIANTWAVIVRSDHTRNQKIDNPLFCKINNTQNISKSYYGITGKSTELTLDKNWMGSDDLLLSSVRETTVYAQSDELLLSEMPFQPDKDGVPADIQGESIELQKLYDGLQSGRWIIVSGERTDIVANQNKVVGIKTSELAMISGVNQAADPALPGDKVHTTLQLANQLAYTYKRETVSIYGNVVKATHGETRHETLGAGDSSKALLYPVSASWTK